jgi:hypothetical protein
MASFCSIAFSALNTTFIAKSGNATDGQQAIFSTLRGLRAGLI